MNADQLLDNYNELQKIELRQNLTTFTLKELKKEIIKMKADKFAVTKMKRNQIIELIVQYHYLFPHLLTKRGSKGTKQITKKKPAAKLPQLAYKPTQQITPPTQQQLPPITLKHIENVNKLLSKKGPTD